MYSPRSWAVLSFLQQGLVLCARWRVVFVGNLEMGVGGDEGLMLGRVRGVRVGWALRGGGGSCEDRIVS